MEALFADLYAEAGGQRGRISAWWLAIRACTEVPPRAFRAHAALESPPGVGPVRRFLSDVKFAVRAVVRRPRHSLVVGATIAVGIGAITAVFSVVDAAVLRPLPFPDADRLVELTHRIPDRDILINSLDTPMIAAWREQTQIFDAVEAVRSTEPVAEIDARPYEMDGAAVSPGLLPMLGARPLAGRLLVADDVVPGAPPVALVSRSLWDRRFGTGRDIDDASIVLDDVEHRVVGVLPDGFAFPYARTQVWTPADATDPEFGERLRTYARLRPGMSLARAQEAADAVAAGMSEANPRRLGWSIGMVAFQESRVQADTRKALWLALGAAAVMLGIAVMNVAHVSLVQAIERGGELAIRRALGAGRARIARQVVLESTFTALLGGTAGVGLAFWMVKGIERMAPERLVSFDAVAIDVDWRAMLFAAVVSVATGIAAGLVPVLSSAWRGRAPGQNAVIGSRTRRRFHATLVAVETGAALVLLAGAALLIASFGRLVSLDPGFDPDGVASVVLQLDEERYPTPEARFAFLQELTGHIHRVRGVVDALPTGGAPPDPGGIGLHARIEGEGGASLEDGLIMVPYGTVAPGYFALTGIPLLSGREFTEADYGTDAVIISEHLARALWGDTDPVGRTLDVDDNDTWFHVVGVVGDVWSMGIDRDDDRYQMYYPIRGETSPWAYSAIVVRTSGDPAALAGPLREAVWSIDPAQAVSRIQLARDSVGDWYVAPRFYVVLMSTFAGTALLLALVGLFGVVGHAVASRTREIGIRVALGADDASILKLATLGGLGPAAVGLALGAVGVWQTHALLASLFHGVRTEDPVTLVLTCLAFLACTALASYVPARRALRVNPVEALRSE